MDKLNFTIDNRIPEISDIVSLYDDAGWTAYTEEPEILQNAIGHSLKVYAAWHAGELVGMARIVGDGFTIVYIQDILVKNTYRRQGIGRSLVEMILSDYGNVRQRLLLTDISSDTDSFYRALGFVPVSETGCRAYIRV